MLLTKMNHYFYVSLVLFHLRKCSNQNIALLTERDRDLYHLSTVMYKLNYLPKCIHAFNYTSSTKSIHLIASQVSTIGNILGES